MSVPNEKELATLALDLLSKCQPGDGIDIETTCGNTVLRVFVKRDHPGPQAQPTPETQGT